VIENPSAMLAELGSCPHPAHVVEGTFLEAKILRGLGNGEKGILRIRMIRECRFSYTADSTLPAAVTVASALTREVSVVLISRNWPRASLREAFSVQDPS
jgi:hypothetical protein